MRRRAIVPAVVLVLASASTAFARPRPLPLSHSTLVKWPPWLSIEAPVNPFDPATRGAVLLVHTMVREGAVKATDLSGSAEGLVGGSRRSIAIRFDDTAHPGVFAVRRQWPAGGTWLLRITLLRNTTALVTLGPSGDVAAVSVPTRMSADGMPLPRAVAAQEIDSALAVAARRQ